MSGKFRRQGLLPLLLGMVLFSGKLRAAGAAAGEVPGRAGNMMKVAVVCVDANGHDAAAVAALLAAGLSGDKNFDLVERQAVGAVLKEQSLESLSDSAQTVKFGRLVGADMLLFCQEVEGSKPPLLRLRVVETRDGVILSDQVQELQALTGDPGSFRHDLELAVKKAEIPRAERKFVGVVDVASEEPGKSLDPLAATLDVLVRVDLAKSSSVVVLERQQLQQLIAERGLSGMDVKLRAAAKLLAVRITRAKKPGAEDKLDITVSISDMSGGKAAVLHLTEPRDDLAVLRSRLAEGILKALAAPFPPEAASDIHAEAAAFHTRSEMLLAHGYLKQALLQGETAYTLDPQISYFDTIAHCCQDLFQGIDPSLRGNVSFDYSHVATMEQLNAALLLAQMHLDASHRVAESIPANVTDPKTLQWGPLITDFNRLSPMFPLPDPPKTAEQKMAVQLLDLADRERRLWTEVYKQRHWPPDALNYLTIIVGPYLARDGADYCHQAQAAYEEFQHEQAAWLQKKTDHPPVYPDLTLTFNMMYLSGHVGNVSATDVRPLLIWLTKQPDPILQAQGWNALAHWDGSAGGQAALHAVDALFRGKPLFTTPQNVFYFSWQHDLFTQRFFGDFSPVSFLPPNTISCSLTKLSDENRLAAYTAGLLDELEKRGDPLPLVRRTRQASALLHLEPKEDLALSLRMQKLIDSKPVPAELAKNLGILQSNLTDRIRICQQSLGMIPDKTNRWDTVKVRQIKYQSAPAGAPRLFWVSVDHTRQQPDLLTLWRSDPINEHDGRADFTLVVGRLSLEGGPITEIARGKFSGPALPFFNEAMGFRVASVLPTPAGIFITDFRRGLLVVRNGKITAWTGKDGLASEQIWSLAWHHHTLYAGADDGFMTIDPNTAQCHILASGKAPASTNPFDGRSPYRIANILPAPDDRSLWLAVGGDATRMGVWRYYPDSDTYDHVVQVSDHDPQLPMKPSPGPSMTWHQGNLLIIMSPDGNSIPTPMGILDARSGQWLKTYYGERADMAGVADRFLEAPNAQKVFNPIVFTPQYRAALTSIGLIGEDGDAVDPARDKGFYYNWHLEDPIDTGEVEVTLFKSRIATTQLCRFWKTIEEVGSGFVVSSFGNRDMPPVVWFLTPPKMLPPPAVAEFEKP